MCGRYAVTLPPEAMRDLFKTGNTIDFPPRHNIAPTQPIVAIMEEQGQRIAKLVRWGFVPAWVKDPREFPLLINARAESMAEKPAFRDALKHQRCIIPASGYYEWRTAPDKTRQPYYVTLADGTPMALAGLFSIWVGPDGEEVDTAATITVAANPDLSAIHNRMPAILPPEAIDDWLNVREVSAREAFHLARPLPNGVVRFHPVSTRVNSAKMDDPSLLEAVTLEPIGRPAAEGAPIKTATRAKRAAAGNGQLDLF